MKIMQMDQKQVKLTNIELPTFEGKLEDWPQFRDLYPSLIHKNGFI